MANAQISFGPKLGLLNNAAIGEIYYDQLRPFLRGMDALVQLTAISYLSSPPGSPSDGDTYIVISGSGDWSGNTNQVAVYSAQITQMGTDTLNPGWDYYTPEAGWIGFVGGTGFVYFNGTNWVDLILTATTSNLGVVKPDGTTITIADGVISATGSGSVSSVGLSVPSWQSVTGSPVTGAGTLTVTDNTQTAHFVFAGPTSGSAASPTFRALVSSDLPVATSSQLGAVQPDGTIITVSAGDITVAKASSSIFGVVKVDGTTITAASGVISASASGAANYTQLPVSLPAPNGSTSYALGFTPAAPAASFYFVNGIKRVYGTYYEITGSNLIILAATPPNTANGDSGHELYAS